jgi:hypothetical protein
MAVRTLSGALEELAIEAGLDAVRAWEADHGPFTEDELAEADAVLDRGFRADTI